MIGSSRISRRDTLRCAGATVLLGAGKNSGSMRNLLIRCRDTITLTGRGASLSGLRSAVQEIARSGGGTIRLDTAKLLIDTVELAASGSIELPSAIEIEGNHALIAFVGKAIAPPLFVARDVSQLGLRNIRAVGNNRAAIDTISGSFAMFELTAAATEDSEDFRLENIQLSEFRAERWLQFLQRHPERRMSGLRITDLNARGGSSLAPYAIGVAAAPLWIYGIEGEINDIEVRRPVVDAAQLKSGVVLFHKIRNATIVAADVSNAGLHGAGDDAAAYALMAYGDRGEMSDISIVSPVIQNPRSAGIYLRGADNVRVTGALISGQTDRVSINLPKGAIALNGSSNVAIEDCRFHDNIVDLSVADGGLSTLNLDVRRMVASGSETSILLEVSPGKAPVSGAKFLDCKLSATSRVFRVLNEQFHGRYYNDIWVLGGSFHSATATHVIEFTQGQTTNATNYHVEDVTIEANDVGIIAAGMQGKLIIRRTTIKGLGKLNYGILADGCPGIDWDMVTFQNMPTGYAYSARPMGRKIQGSLKRLRFMGIANPRSGGSLPDNP